MKLRYLFLLPELVLLFFFVFPIFKRICNPGNLAGILVCLFLLFVTLFPQVFAQWIRHLWGHLGGKIGLSAVCVLTAAGLVFSAVMSVQMTRAVLRHPAQPETVVVLGCKVRGTRPSRMLLRRLEAAQKYLEENPDIAADVEAQIRANFDKLMGNQSRIAAAKAAGKAVNVSADDFNDED